MEFYPTELKRLEGRRLLIVWSDGHRRTYTYAELRENCPCATCRETHGPPEPHPAELLPVISASEAQPIDITAMAPVGSYAYKISFNDGHDSGIYTFQWLRHLGTEVED